MHNGEDNKIQTAETTESDKFFSSLVLLSVKTLFYLLLVIAVSISAISQIFPFTAMKFYSDLEDYETAVKYAKTQTERGGKNRFDALFEGVKMSERLFFDAETAAETKYAAEYLLYFTKEFAALEDFDARCKAWDKYFEQNTASTIAKVGLYSFRDYIFCLNTAADSALSPADKLLYDGGYTPLNQKGYITQDELNLMFCDISYGGSPDTAELAIIFNQISENITWGGGSLIFDRDTNDTTPLYDLMLLFIKSDVGYGYINEVLPMALSIEKLYLLRAAAMLGENIKALFSSLTDLTDREEQIAISGEVFSVLQDDEQIPLYEYYRSELAKL